MTLEQIIIYTLLAVLLARSVLLQWRLARLQRECEWRVANLQRAVFDICGWLAKLDVEVSGLTRTTRRRSDPQEARHAERN